MRIYGLLFVLLLLGCKEKPAHTIKYDRPMGFTEAEILKALDYAKGGIPSPDFPVGNSGDIKYNFFLDLEDAYCIIAGNKIHLYADSTRWAIVCESNGYHTRQSEAVINLFYIGNCITYNIEKFPNATYNPSQTYISNASHATLIDYKEFEKILNKSGTEMEQFELISPHAMELNVRGKKVKIEHNPTKYEAIGIKFREFDNPKKLIGYGDLIRYLSETEPETIAATDDDIRKHIPHDLPKLMTINKFHYISRYADSIQPSQQETFQLMAKILVTKDTSLWKPAVPPNNHWMNWESGNL